METSSDDRELYAGLIRLHILYHAAEEPIFGLGMIEELGRHGYRLSPGTLYPILHRLEEKGYLSSRLAQEGSRRRRLYRATPSGVRALERAKKRVSELFGELFEGDGDRRGPGSASGIERSDPHLPQGGAIMGDGQR